MTNSFYSSQLSGKDVDFNELFKEQKPGLLRYLIFRLGNEQEAEEVLQEVFIQYLKAKEKLDVKNPHALLVRICSTQAIDRIRQNSSRARREQHWSEGYYRSHSVEGDIGGMSAFQDRNVLAREGIQNVLTALDELSETVRQAFILHRFEGLTHGEVAVRLGLSRSTVEKHIVKAGKHLINRIG